MRKKNIRLETKKNGILIDFRPDCNSLIPRRIKEQLRENCMYGVNMKLSVRRE